MKQWCSGAFMSIFLYKLRKIPGMVEALAESRLSASNACIEISICLCSMLISHMMTKL
jgi:hypothetical protein